MKQGRSGSSGGHGHGVAAPPDSAVKTVGVDGGFNVYKISNVAVVAAVVGPEGDDGRVMKGALLDGEKSFLPG